MEGELRNLVRRATLHLVSLAPETRGPWPGRIAVHAAAAWLLGGED